MNYQRVSLLMATRKRPEYLKAFIDSYYATAGNGNNSEIIFRVDNDDLETIQLLCEHRWPIIVGPRHRGYASMPLFYNEMARLATGDLLMGVNDDVVIETPGWPQILIEAAKLYPDGIFNIGVDTGLNDDFFPFFCLSRKVVDRLGFINDERLLFSDVFLLDVFKHFGRTVRLPTIMFRHDWAGHTADAVRREAHDHEMSLVFADAQGNWTDSYRRLHDGIVAEAVAKIDPEGEFLAGQALLGYENNQAPEAAPGSSYWPPAMPPVPWSAPHRASAGIHYHRDEIFELFKVIVTRRLPRRRVLLIGHDFGQPAVLWGQLYDRVVSVHHANEPGPEEHGKYRIEFGDPCATLFMYSVLERCSELNALVLDHGGYPQLISAYFLVKPVMQRPSLIVVMNTGIQEGNRNSPHPRRFVDDLASGRLDGATHRFTHIELPGGKGISYETLQ